MLDYYGSQDYVEASKFLPVIYGNFPGKNFKMERIVAKLLRHLLILRFAG
jgi:hypothetical protein